MGHYRIVNEPDYRGNWFSAEKRYMWFFWSYVSDTIASTEKEALRKLNRVLVEGDKYKKRIVWSGQL